VPGISVAVFCISLPFPGVQLRPIESFVPIYVTVMFLNGLTTAVILFDRIRRAINGACDRYSGDMRAARSEALEEALRQRADTRLANAKRDILRIRAQRITTAR
jgi:uncharacterized protein YbjQ (UPF0145 family)